MVNTSNKLSTGEAFVPQKSDLEALPSRDTLKYALGGSPREAIQQYIELNPSVKKINTSELSKLVGVTRQRVSQILDELGEIRHKRTGQITKNCPICDVEITKNANACRKHSHKKDNRIEGYKYRCKSCNKL